MKIIRLLIYLFFSSVIFNCKSTIETTEKKENLKSNELNWEYFELKKPIEGKIIYHLKSGSLCGIAAFASVSIVETQNEGIFRVLDLCNNLEISENELVKITPSKKPEYHVILPSRTFVIQEFNKTENIEFENKILKTTYGNIEKE